MEVQNSKTKNMEFDRESIQQKYLDIILFDSPLPIKHDLTNLPPAFI